MRASRLVSMMLLLQARGRMTADDLAAELEVSVRTIYRDVEALHSSGVPLYGEPGRDGGYRLLDGYRTRLTGLTGDEAAALALTALPGPAAELGLGMAATAAAVKIRAALSAELRERADHVDRRLHVDPRDWYADPRQTPFLAEVADAVWRQRRLQVRYRRWREPREVDRVVEPLGLVLKTGRWYVVARSAEELRTYRVSHLLQVRPLEEEFIRPVGFDLAAHWRDWVADFDGRRHDEQAARVRLSPRVLQRLSDLLEPAIVQSILDSAGEPDSCGWVSAAFPIESIEHAHGELLRLGADVEVTAPPVLRERLARTVAELAAMYGAAPRTASVQGLAG
jgi:predicted DNA-binding transcriptional regulator YafY